MGYVAVNTLRSPAMPVHADILVESARGRLLLAVECKAFSGYSAEDASQLRHMLLTHERTPDATFFMLMLPDRVYLWKQDAKPDALPDFDADARPLLREYMGRHLDQPNAACLADCITLALICWLNDLAAGWRIPNPKLDAERVLLASGLYEQMKDGTVRAGVGE